MFIHRLVFAVVASVLLMGQGFVTNPSSRTRALSGDSVTLQGFVDEPGQTVTIQALDQTTGVPENIGSITASNSPTNTYRVARCYSGGNAAMIEGTPLPTPLPPPCTLITYTLYQWTWMGKLDDKYWAPQLPFAAGVPTSQGHLELFASVGTSNGTITLPTFSTEAFNAIVWSVGSYNVGPANSGITIYALVCAPYRNGNFPVVIYNHGGINYGAGVDRGSLHGNVTSAGWTSQPTIPPPPGSPKGTQPTPLTDDLGQCIDWAKRGWIFAMSSYRDEEPSRR